MTHEHQSRPQASPNALISQLGMVHALLHNSVQLMGIGQLPAARAQVGVAMRQLEWLASACEEWRRQNHAS